MHGPNNIENYKLMEDVLKEMKTDPFDFAGSVYTEEDVRQDLDLLKGFHDSPNYVDEGQRGKKALILERTFATVAETDDWFGEYASYGDHDFVALVTFPTTEIDDVFNHVDLVCMINNEQTGNEVLPFAIDLTYNVDDEKMHKKFGWRHTYGRKSTVSDEVSEFKVPFDLRRGLKIPGFTSVKYYEDTNNPWTPMHEKGRINIMPRFIVGYSPDIAEVLAFGKPTEKDLEEHGEAYYRAKNAEYQKAEARARWCTLLECHQQALDIYHMLEHIDKARYTQEDELKEFEEAKKQIIAMVAYFERAIYVAAKEADENIIMADARQYAEGGRDKVYQCIMEHSKRTYDGVR